MTTLTVMVPVVGTIDNGYRRSFKVMPGKYQVEQVDDGDVWLVVGAVHEVCVIVTYAALGLVECPCCDGRGEYSYRVSEDEFDTDECDNCEGIGGVTPDEAARLHAIMDDARSGIYE